MKNKKLDTEMARAIGAEYSSSLADLTVNSKPLINMLTILAEENMAHAEVIVQSVQTHLAQVRSEIKLPVLYLVDSIVKNVGGSYKALFTQCIVNMFCDVFEKVDERTRSQMYRLRQTWNALFPPVKLYALDVRVNCLDPAWPITALPPTGNIHVNPNFLKKTDNPDDASSVLPSAFPVMRTQLLSKQRELLELERKKLELQLEATKRCLDEQAKQLAAEQLPQRLPSKTSLPPRRHITPIGSSQVSSSSTQSKAMSTISKITPASSGLIDSARKIRDPRLARFQQVKAGGDKSTVLPTPPTTINKISEPNVKLVKPNKTKSQISMSLDCSSSSTENVNGKPKEKVVEVTNSPKKTPSSFKSRSHTKSKSPITNSLKVSSSISGTNCDKVSKSDSKVTLMKKDVAVVQHKQKRDPRHKGSVASNPSTANVALFPSHNIPSRNSEYKKSPKKVKVSPKNHHGKRNKKVQNISPPSLAAFQVAGTDSGEVMDMDLRVKGDHTVVRVGGLPPPEKQARIETDDIGVVPVHLGTEPCLPKTLDEKDASKDVDLRALPSPAVLSEVKSKRSSTDKSEHPAAKKSKAEVFDKLFGNEDVDLRPMVFGPKTIEAEMKPLEPLARMFTPPPPIISKTDNLDESQIAGGWAKVKELTPVVCSETLPQKESNFDAVRLKLAEATKNRDRLGRPLLYNKLPDDPTERRRTISVSRNTSKDMDLRHRSIPTDDQIGLDNNIKIILTQAQEQIKSGTINQTQYNELVKQIVQLSEKRKLFEAQRRESLNLAQGSSDNLTPISDDELCPELEVCNNFSEPNQGTGFVEPRPPQINPMQMLSRGPLESSQHGESFQQCNMRPNCPPWENDMWRGPSSWEKRQLYRPHVRFPYQWRGQRPMLAPRMDERFQRPMMKGHSRFDRFNNRTISPPIINNSKIHNKNLFEKQKDSIRTVNIDGVPREIRFYDEISIVMMSFDDPREIGFQDGCRRITFDDHNSFVLGFNEPYKTVMISGVSHQIKFGSPTRELYIDGNWFECFFGGPPLGVHIDGHVSVVKMDGPPPQVRLGAKRSDLCAGRVYLMIDAKIVAHVFLDAKPQEVTVHGAIVTVRFANALETVYINDCPHESDFGGLPRGIMINGKKHYIRFTALPAGVKAGYVNIKGMSGARYNSPISEIHPNDETVFNSNHSTGLPEDSNSLQLQQKSEQCNTEKNLTVPIDQGLPNGHDIPKLLPIGPPNNVSGYQMEEQTIPPNDEHTLSAETNRSTPPFVIPPALNINELFEKLVATGIVPIAAKPPTPEPQQIEAKEVVKPVSFDKMATLKVRQDIFIKALYNGMQCSSCGARFPPEQTMKYSQHLDWHFRQNRRERDSTRKAHSRKWYYDVSDWIQYEEIEDLEEREKNWFENQQALDIDNINKNEEFINNSDEAPTVAAGQNETDTRCHMCHDKFEQFYNEEKEEWHLRMAVRVDENTYHPLCYEDYKRSLMFDESNVADVEKGSDGNTTDKESNETQDVEEISPVIISTDSPSSSDIVEDPTTISTTQNNAAEIEIVLEDNDLQVNDIKIAIEDSKTDDSDGDVKIEEPIIETVNVNDEDDPFEDIEMVVKIKQEPVDPETDIDIGDIIMEPVSSRLPDNTQTALISSIDGNVKHEPTGGSMVPLNKIKINISKPVATIECTEQSQDGCDKSEIKLKPALQNTNLQILEPVNRGTELSGFCSIM